TRECAGSSETLARALAALGKTGEARAVLQHALDVAGQVGDAVLRAQMQLSLSEVSLREGDAPGAQALAETALAQFQASQDSLSAADAQLVLASALVHHDEPRARAMLAAAVAAFKAAGPVGSRGLRESNGVARALAAAGAHATPAAAR